MKFPVSFYIPSSVFMAYTDKKPASASARDIIRFLKVSLTEDVYATVLLPPPVIQHFNSIRKSLRGKILGKDVLLWWSREMGEVIKFMDEDEFEFILNLEKDSDVIYKLKLRRFSVIDRILTTHILFEGCYRLAKWLSSQLDLDTVYGFKAVFEIDYADVRSFAQATRLLELEREIRRRLSLFHKRECKNKTITVNNEVKGFAESMFTPVSFNTIFQYCLADWLLTVHGDTPLFTDEYAKELEDKLWDFKWRLLDAAREISERKEQIMRFTDSPLSFAERLLKERKRFSLDDDEIKRLIEEHGLSIHDVAESLRLLERVGRCFRENGEWVCNERQ